jgi:RHS repeat-associated protein
LTNDGSATYSYSDRGRMSGATVSGGTVAYLYNGREQRVSKTGPKALVPTGAAYYVYDEEGQLLGEYDADLVPVHETVYLGDLPVAALKQSGSGKTANLQVLVYDVYSDHLNTPRVITRAADQAIVFRFDQRFPGQVFDPETGLMQNWHREYGGKGGRYTQSDPIGLAGGSWSTYSYAGGNPLSFSDPDGLHRVLPGPIPLPVPGPPQTNPSPRPVDPTEPNGPSYTPGWSWPDLTPDWVKNWMESRRGQGDPARPPDVNPGRDCDGKCNPCPPSPPGWSHEGDAHGSTGGRHYHRWVYNQDPATCICRAGRKSGPMPF